MLYTLGNIGEAVNPLGRQTIWLPGGAWTPDETSGPEQLASGHLDFDAALKQEATTEVFLPKSWDGKGLTGFVSWKHVPTTTNFNVHFGIQAVALANGSSYATAFGTAQTVTDTGGLTNRVYDTAEFANIVPANSPVGGKFHRLNFYRDPSLDTLAVNATVVGVTLFYDINRAKDN